MTNTRIIIWRMDGKWVIKSIKVPHIDTPVVTTVEENELRRRMIAAFWCSLNAKNTLKKNCLLGLEVKSKLFIASSAFCICSVTNICKMNDLTGNLGTAVPWGLAAGGPQRRFIDKVLVLSSNSYNAKKKISQGHPPPEEGLLRSPNAPSR